MIWKTIIRKCLWKKGTHYHYSPEYTCVESVIKIQN